LREQEVEIERLKFHASNLRLAAIDAAKYLEQLARSVETPAAELQHVVFVLASSLATSRNLQL
jgi:hypothetical protein